MMKSDISFIYRLKLALKNFSYLIVGNVIAQIFSIIGLLIITKYLGVYHYGIYATVTSYVSIFLFFTLPQLNKVLIREGARYEDRLDLILSNSIGIRLITGILSIILCLAGLIFVKYDIYTKMLIAIFSITLLLTSFNELYLIIYQVKEQMQYYSIIQVINRFLYFISILIVVYFDLGLSILLISSIICFTITFIINVRISRSFANIKFKLFLDLRWSLLKPVIIFSILLFLGHLATSIDILMISNLRPFEDVGIYNLAIMLFSPGMIIRQLLFVSTFPLFIKIFKRNSEFDIKRLFQFGILMGAIVLIGASILSILSKPIIGFLFPKEYLKSVPIFSVLVFYLAFRYFELPFYNALQATGNEGKMLLFYWIPPFVNIILNILFLKWFGLIGIAYSTMIVGLITVLLLSVLSAVVLKKNKINNII